MQYQISKRHKPTWTLPGNPKVSNFQAQVFSVPKVAFGDYTSASPCFARNIGRAFDERTSTLRTSIGVGDVVYLTRR